MTPNAIAPAPVAAGAALRPPLTGQLPIHVLQLGPYPPPHGGVQSNIVAIRKYLRAHGTRSSVVNLTRFRQPESDDVYYPRNAWELATRLVQMRPDVIHLHIGGDLRPRLILLGLLCTCLPWSKTVLTLHSGGFPTSARGRRMHRFGFTAAILRRCDRLIAVNQQIAEFFARLGCETSRVDCIRPDAVPALTDAGDPTDATSAVASALREFFERHDPALVTVGLLEPEYDLPLQIELVGRLVARHPRVGLAIIGSGTLERETRRAIAGRPWAGHIALCGDVPHAATLHAIAEARILLRTTHYDGDSVAVREALHLGTPVIASDNGMRPAGARLIPARDLAALEAAVEATLADASVDERAAPAQGDDRNIARVADIYRAIAGTPAR